MGRPLSSLRGRTEQANALGGWLRQVTRGVPVRQLEGDFPYSKTTWSEFRSGSKLIPQELLDQVVARYIPEPAMRERHLAEGRRLLAQAQEADRASEKEAVEVPVVARPRRGDPVAEALLRLDDAWQRQIEAMQKLATSERRCAELQNMVVMLGQRCSVLEEERDRAREHARAELEQELQLSVEYRRQADEDLEHARRAQQEAFALRLAVEEQVAREQAAVQRQVDGAPAAQPQYVPDVGEAPELHLPPLEAIGDVLRAAQKQLEEQDQDLDELRHQIGLSDRSL